MSKHQIQNKSLSVTIEDAGAELVSVMDKRTGSERIWTGEPAIWNRHAPILFPFVGKVMNGRYRIGDKSYEMKTQHGFARDLPFSLVEKDGDSISHCLLSDPATKEIYPYDFCLTVRHLLEADLLTVEWVIENTGNEDMYFSIGGHPGFLLPDSIQKEDCLIGFPEKDQLEYFNANPQGFAMPADKKTLVLQDGAAAYQPDVPDTWIFEEQHIDRVQILLPDHKPYVTMNCTNFPLLAVWANKGGPFICLEPWYGRTDDDGFTGSLEEKPGIQKLSAWQKTSISYSMEFHA